MEVVEEYRKTESIVRRLQKQPGDPWEFVICYNTVSTLGFWLFRKTLPQMMAMIDRDLHELGEEGARKMRARFKAMKVGDVEQYRGYMVVMRVPKWGKNEIPDAPLMKVVKNEPK